VTEPAADEPDAWTPSITATWFIALPVAAGPWFEKLPPPANKTSVFHPDDLHLTIAFFGRVGEDRALAGWERFRWPLGRTTVSLGEVVGLGDPRRPSALSALLVRGREDVERAMGESRGVAIEAAGAEPDKRPPKAHVTLARPSRSASSRERARAVEWAKTIDLRGAEIALDRVALYASGSGPEGRRYKQVRTLTLSLV
jgi:RNA 2',3'-cyclic 3'-phosphodiesterase